MKSTNTAAVGEKKVDFEGAGLRWVTGRNMKKVVRNRVC